MLHALQRLGVRVLNNARAIEACVDKSMTSFLIARAGIATPDTWALESFERARALVDRECAKGPLVLKPLFGAQGKGLRLVRGPRRPSAARRDRGGVYYLQRFERVDGEGFRDFRLFVCGGRVVAAMMRRAPTWITNVKQGGEPFAVARDAQLEALALAAARAVGADIAGVDLIVGADGPKVLEVNSMPAWRGLQKVTDANIADRLAERNLAGARLTLAARIAEAYIAACLLELDALKPGNVHRHAEGHGMTVADFERSAEVSAPALARTGASVGSRVLEAVEATRAAVGQNTNLGIVLLAAPLAAAAERREPDLRVALARVLGGPRSR